MPRKTVGVMGSDSKFYTQLAEPVGELLARRGWNLLTGGAGGVMTSVARGFSSVSPRAGVSIGIIRAGGETHLGVERRKRDYQPVVSPNPWIELPIFTHLPHSGERGKDDLSRNHINVLTSDSIVALPGGAGTLSEVELALEYGKPLVFYLGDEKIDGKTAEEMLSRHSGEGMVARDLGELEEALGGWLAAGEE